MASPIWKDYSVDLGTTDGQAFTIYDKANNTGNVIYSGKAYLKPGASHVYVKVNDICADYLHQLIAASFGAASDAENYDTSVPVSHAFSLYVGATKKSDWVFYLNWEYKDGGTDKVNATANVPITGRIQQGMKAPLSCLVLGGTQQVTVNHSGTQSSIYVGPAPFNLYSRAASTDTFLNLAVYGGASVSYKVVPKCHRYALYYVNELGGVDVLLLEGKCRITDSYDRKTYKQSYDNGDARNRGTVNYNNDITRAWELHTGWLTDAEAGRMRHLLGSTLVFLCDCDDDNTLHPVTILNGDCPEKNHKDGMIEYGINVELARDMVRR